ncbi:MAG TPA: AI-2E family transporter [Caulobacteraceae bacterium]|nr:AI-2E family transporter [Caulobacteraceae bacterium]
MGALRNAAVFMAVVLALSLIRFFQDILSPLVVAAFMIVLVDGLARAMQRRLPGAPAWLRGGLGGVLILASFGFVAGLFVVEAPPFAVQVRSLAPKLDDLLFRALTMLGAPPITLEQMFSGVDPGRLVGEVFATARHFTSYAALVVIYFGFLAVSRATFSRKFDRLYTAAAHRASALRVLASVSHAVERYAWLQTFKALIVAAAAWSIMAVMGLHDALFVAFLVFLTAYVPIVGAVVGSVFPGILALSQFDDLGRPLLIVVVLASAVFVIDNVVMPKLQGDELNLDPLFILISLGFWAAILGAPGVLLSTPLTVTVMALAAEFESTRWVAILLSRDGRPGDAPLA